MNGKNIYVFILLSLSHALVGAEKTEKTPLLQPKKSIAKYIRAHDKNGLAIILAKNPSLVIPESLIQLAHAKAEVRNKNCCINFFPVLVSAGCTLFSAILALQQLGLNSPARPYADIGLWGSSAGSVATGGYYGVETIKDWSNYFGSKSIVQMLKEHNEKLKNP